MAFINPLKVLEHSNLHNRKLILTTIFWIMATTIVDLSIHSGSKYQPGTYCFLIALENHWKGELLTLIEKALGLARTMTYQNVVISDILNFLQQNL